jgi:hypothetical protein
MKWKLYLGVFLAVVIAEILTTFVYRPIVVLGLPFGLDSAIVSAIIVLVLFIILDRIGL